MYYDNHFNSKGLRLICSITAVISMTAFLCACGAGTGNNAGKTAESTTAQSITVENTAESTTDQTADTEKSEVADSSETESGAGSLSHEGYTLEKIVILSRHNIRSPLSGKDSLLSTVTPHEWFSWTSKPSELSIRGGALETEMGQYFRTWLEAEGLFPENYNPEDEAVRIYANSKQRTIATARYFASGLLPTSNIDVEYHEKLDEMDPVFNPRLTFDSDAYSTAADQEMKDMFDDDIQDLSDNYELMSDVIDMEDSPAYKNGEVKQLSTDDTSYILDLNEEPQMKGSLKTACSISDALVLQYYETDDEKKAAFDNNLSTSQWEDIAEIKDVYVDALFTAPLVAANVANPLLKEIKKELTTDQRKFTFLCGHDSNVASILAALDVEEYELPAAIEKKTPIGCKLVISRFKGKDGAQKISADMVYQNTDQLKNVTLLESGVHPMIYPLSFKNLERDEDGLYDADEFMAGFDEAIKDYMDIQEEYK